MGGKGAGEGEEVGEGEGERAVCNQEEVGTACPQTEEEEDVEATHFPQRLGLGEGKDEGWG